MRITTRVSLALFLICALLIAGLTYQLSQVETLQSVNRDVSQITMEGGRVSLSLLQALDGVNEFAAKYQVLPDPAYETQWRESERAVGTYLRSLGTIGLSGREREILDHVEGDWQRYLDISPPLQTESTSVLPGVVFLQIQAILTDLRADVEELIAVNQSVVQEQMVASNEAAQRARTFAWVSALTALFVAAAMSLLLYRSISGPLRRLTRGTREIARGRFDHRLRIQGPRELSSLAKDFDRMAARLDELENLKRDFVSHVSHELKTPLAAIRETIEVLLDELPGPLTPKQARLLELSRSSSDRLSGMIADLLETSRLEAGATGYVPGVHDLAGIIRSVLDEMEPLAVERGLEIVLRLDVDDATFVCDRNRMRDVVVNLVSNALKFSPEGGRVRMVVSEVDDVPGTCPANRRVVRGESGPFLALSVWDEGPGVPDRDKDGIFEKFHQVRRGERLRGQGVGLGLAIAWRIVDAHSGAIWVEDATGGGSVFWTVLPRVPSQWTADVDLKHADRTTGASADGSMPTRDEDERDEMEEDVTEPVAGTPVPQLLRTGSGRALLGVVTSMLAVGCATAAPPSAAVEPEPLPDPVSEATVSPVVEAPPEVQVDPGQQRLDTGWSFFAEGDYGSAYEQFQGIVEDGSSRTLVGEAVWAMALLHLEPQASFFDPAWSRLLLSHLETHFAGDGIGMQARWARVMLEDLSGVRATVAAQEAALRELNETVEQLKSIDLNRAPGGSATAPGGAAATPGGE